MKPFTSTHFPRISYPFKNKAYTTVVMLCHFEPEVIGWYFSLNDVEIRNLDELDEVHPLACFFETFAS